MLLAIQNAGEELRDRVFYEVVDPVGQVPPHCVDAVRLGADDAAAWRRDRRNEPRRQYSRGPAIVHDPGCARKLGVARFARRCATSIKQKSEVVQIYSSGIFGQILKFPSARLRDSRAP